MAKYPEKDWGRVKKLVKKALEKGLEEGIIVRPKAAENMTGMTGRFKVDKDVLKAKTSKPKKPAAAAEAAKPKSPRKMKLKPKAQQNQALQKQVLPRPKLRARRRIRVLPRRQVKLKQLVQRRNHWPRATVQTQKPRLSLQLKLQKQNKIF